MFERLPLGRLAHLRRLGSRNVLGRRLRRGVRGSLNPPLPSTIALEVLARQRARGFAATNLELVAVIRRLARHLVRLGHLGALLHLPVPRSAARASAPAVGRASRCERRRGAGSGTRTAAPRHAQPRGPRTSPCAASGSPARREGCGSDEVGGPPGGDTTSLCSTGAHTSSEAPTMARVAVVRTARRFLRVVSVAWSCVFGAGTERVRRGRSRGTCPYRTTADGRHGYRAVLNKSFETLSSRARVAAQTRAREASRMGSCGGWQAAAARASRLLVLLAEERGPGQLGGLLLVVVQALRLGVQEQEHLDCRRAAPDRSPGRERQQRTSATAAAAQQCVGAARARAWPSVRASFMPWPGYTRRPLKRHTSVLRAHTRARRE